jgi:hypothetical protein
MTQFDVCMHICTFELTENVVILTVSQTMLILKLSADPLTTYVHTPNIPYLPLAFDSEGSELIIKNHAITYG